ncbi:MAG: hypothetical protein HWQ38_19125 [Nostoc sp. NMS7]|uniref:hypothetical protein n=1 Tax=Nostoc sp. NMS7 TaxID=2815391 RepID=UPI0025F3344D|nr:hypothetical protein [Nostoc sp. NMS7]MBN3948449.1 hypothetical protein [Nostoc sp. NMS7]
MVCQIASPIYSDMLDDLIKQDSITQELTKSRMDEVQQVRKLERMERKTHKQAEVESKFLEWSKNIHGKRVLNIVEIPEAVGNELEQMFAAFKKASECKADFPLFASEIVNICRESERWMEIEALADYNETTDITPETIPLSQVGKGMVVKIVDKNSDRFNQLATISSYNNGSGWWGIFESEVGKDNPQAEWIKTHQVEVVAI